MPHIDKCVKCIIMRAGLTTEREVAMRTTLSSLFAFLLVLATSIAGFAGSANADPHDPARYGGAPCHTHWRIHLDSQGREIGREPLAEHCASARRVIRRVPVIVHQPPVVLIPAPPPVIINHGPRNHLRIRTRDFGFGVDWE